ncbi:MAG: nucleic-acid-binding protein, contains PIN domain protein [Phycisphaerales bacterium]|nr:nucleic-acid-binding protein, contains PIN domain protein [Phycisphaerales bacterium]
MIVTFDTNILLYAADARDARKQSIATQVLHGAPDGVLLWQAAAEFVASSRKLAAHGLAPVQAWNLLAQFVETYGLIVPSPTVLQRARVLHVEQQWSFWDAMLVGACLEAGVTRLYTEDLPGRPPPGDLEIINPFAS